MISLTKIKAYLTVNDVTAGQCEYYPDLEPLRLEQPRNQAMKDVRKAFRGGGNQWTVQEYSPDDGHLTGTVTTPVFGFVDDFEVWLESAKKNPEAWTVMARSQSRVGRGDLGKNARNIRSFYQQLRRIPSED